MKHLLHFLLIISVAFSVTFVVAEEQAKPAELLAKSKRILFLGDSITYAGRYVSAFDAWLLTQRLDAPPVVINCGLSSETVSGLSEVGHAGGNFPRPDLFERLERVLDVSKPDLVFACYGINCGIYLPLDDDRFAAYRKGFERLAESVRARGAELIILTPPVFDDLRSKKDFSYNGVLDHYSSWLVSRRQDGWNVIDVHTAMSAALNKEREVNPQFTYQKDAVHPDEAGHWIMAQQIIRWFGDEKSAVAASPELMLASAGFSADTFPQVQKRMSLRRDAYVGAAGHLRPGVPKGKSIADAEAEAANLAKLRP